MSKQLFSDITRSAARLFGAPKPMTTSDRILEAVARDHDLPPGSVEFRYMPGADIFVFAERGQFSNLGAVKSDYGRNIIAQVQAEEALNRAAHPNASQARWLQAQAAVWKLFTRHQP